MPDIVKRHRHAKNLVKMLNKEQALARNVNQKKGTEISG